MRGAIPPLPRYVFMTWRLGKHGDNFTFAVLKDTAAAATSEVRTGVITYWYY